MPATKRNNGLKGRWRRTVATALPASAVLARTIPREAPCTLVQTNQKYTVGVYHSLTENLTLLAEFTDVKAEAHDGLENDSSNFNIGAYLSF